MERTRVLMIFIVNLLLLGVFSGTIEFETNNVRACPSDEIIEGITIYVGQNISNSYQPIQKAINMAQAGDTVYVYAGTYCEPIKMKDGVDLIGEGAEVTTINANGAPVAVTGASNATLEGFTIINALNSLIRCEDVTNLVVSKNLVISSIENTIGSPTGLISESSDIDIISNTFVNVFQRAAGENGIFAQRGEGTLVIKNNIVAGYTTGIFIQKGSCLSSYNNVINNSMFTAERNYYGNFLPGTGDISVNPGFVNYPIEYSVLGSSYKSNLYMLRGVDLFSIGDNIEHDEDGILRLIIGKSIIKNTPTISDPDIPDTCNITKLTVTPPIEENHGSFQTVYNFGNGSSTVRDYHLQSYSPVIDAGDPLSDLPWQIGARIDMGAFEYNSSKAHKPSAPGSLYGSTGNNSIILKWSPPGSDGGLSVTNYKLYRWDRNCSASTIVTTGNVHTYEDHSINNSKVYYYKVTAVNAVGEGPMSDMMTTATLGPSTPLNFKASVNKKTIELTWDEPADDGGTPIINYNIYRSTSIGNYSLLAMVGDEYKYDDKPAGAGRMYYYKVSAVNTVGEGPFSEIVTANTLDVPSPPSDLKASLYGTFTIINWSAPESDGGTPVTNYKVYRSIESGKEKYYTKLGNVTSFNYTSINASVEYYYKISAVNAVGEGPLSIELYVKTEDENILTTPSDSNDIPEADISDIPLPEEQGVPIPVFSPPLPPDNLMLAHENGYVVLIWEPTGDGGDTSIREYSIYRSIGADEMILLNKVDWSVSSYFDYDISNNTTYHYFVSAINTYGESQSFAEASVKIDNLQALDERQKENNEVIKPSQAKLLYFPEMFIVIALAFIGIILFNFMLIKRNHHKININFMNQRYPPPPPGSILPPPPEDDEYEIEWEDDIEESVQWND